MGVLSKDIRDYDLSNNALVDICDFKENQMTFHEENYENVKTGREGIRGNRISIF